jgi:hypothetical protein
LKEAVTSAPVLVQPDPNKPYTIETDSSDFGNGMALYQEGDDGKFHPIAFDGRKLHGVELKYSTHEKELQYLRSRKHFRNGIIMSRTDSRLQLLQTMSR